MTNCKVLQATDTHFFKENVCVIFYLIDYLIDLYRVNVTFKLLFNINLAVDLAVSCKSQFFVIMIA